VALARLGIDREFLREYAKLERPVQQRVMEVFTKFDEATHAGLHLEKVNKARDDRFRTIRINDFYRGVVLAPDSGDTYTLLTVLPHDNAYAWAQRRQASVNAATGRIEIRDVAAIDDTLPELSRHAERVPERLFQAHKDAELRRLGIDDKTLEFARALTDVSQLEAARGFLPQSQYDVLFGLAAGFTPEQVWTEIGADIAAARFDTEDVSAAVRRTPERVVLVDGPDELMEIFRRPLDLWRIYLHPAQHQVAHARYKGSAQVTGGPGTGKTVVVLHRARELARRREGKILVTTFTATLAASLEAGLALLVELPAERARIDVRNVDQVAYQIFSERYGRPAILTQQEERRIWQRVVRRLRLPFTDAFLSDEWRQVVLAREVTRASDYLEAKRSGRGRRLGVRQKAEVWQAISEFQTELRQAGVWTYEMICDEAARLLRGRTDRPYRHVLVDEAQDFSPSQWRLLRATVAEGSDDVFLVGDAHQRIYQNRVSLRDVGIRVTGRSSRLTVNYRTTAEILAWSLGMLTGERIDDMDGGLQTVTGYRSDVHGERPILRGAADQGRELANLAAQVRRWLDAGVRPGELGIAVRTRQDAKALIPVLTANRIPAQLLGRSLDTGDSVAVGTMHRMKGLEFRCVAVVGVTEGQVPPPNTVTPLTEDESAHQRDQQREKCLLFVACTRAREQLYLSWHSTPSRYLTPLLEGFER
jgi:hypothetical protein